MVVALLKDYDRAHFCLSGRNVGGSAQIAEGKQFVSESKRDMYEVSVLFKGNMFGTFSQWVVFDFGSRPVIVQKLTVHAGPSHVHERMQEVQQKLGFEVWTPQNRDIVFFSDEPTDHFQPGSNMTLQKKYPIPSSRDIDQQTLEGSLNAHNYIHKMHKLLQLEELKQTQILMR